jgi:hypothetical protein
MVDIASVTRFVHVVRCKHPNNPNIWFDVRVTDKISIKLTNGKTAKFDFTAAFATPTITDNTGDGNGVSNGNSATRQTHMSRITSKTDQTQFYDAEVLDKINIKSTNGQQAKYDNTARFATTYLMQITGADLDQSQFESADETIVQDKSSASRLANVYEVGGPGDFVAVEEFQEISFKFTNGQEAKDNHLDQWQNINDTTQYTTDPDTGAQVPPDNSDPDPYIVFPSDSAGNNTQNQLVSQGPLWQIVKKSNVQWGPWLVIYAWYWTTIPSPGGQSSVNPLVISNFNLMAPNLPASIEVMGDNSAFQSFPKIDADKLNDVITSAMKGLTAWVSPTIETFWLDQFEPGFGPGLASYCVINLGAIIQANPKATEFSFDANIVPIVTASWNCATIGNKIMKSFATPQALTYPMLSGQLLIPPPPFEISAMTDIYEVSLNQNGPGLFIARARNAGGVLVDANYWSGYLPGFIGTPQGVKIYSFFQPNAWPWGVYSGLASSNPGAAGVLTNDVGFLNQWATAHTGIQPTNMMYQDDSTRFPVAIDFCRPLKLPGEASVLKVNLKTLEMLDPINPAWPA